MGMSGRSSGLRTMRMAGLAVGLAVAAFFVPVGGSAFAAAPTVTLSPASGPYSNGETITVSGSNFPSSTADPSGLSIIECSDPNGSAGALPTDDSACDGSTVNPLPVTQNSSGSFTTTYQVSSLSTSAGNSINCGATAATECVLWVGVDYVNNFNSNDAFSKAFEITTPVASTPESPLAITLPVGAALLAAAAVVLTRRRRRTVSA